MDTIAFIQAFKHLHTAGARQAALQALVGELTPYEWRDLHAITSTRSFNFDIIAQLPVELVAHVFCYLDPSAPYRLQTVSKRWDHVLPSLHVLKATLDPWFQGTVNLQSADRSLCMKRAQSIHAFRTGKPCQIFKVVPDAHIRNLILAGHILVWLPRPEPPDQSRMACALDLNNWTMRTLQGEAREVIFDVFASDQIAALTTYASVCYVHDLQGTGNKKFRVPSMAYFNNVACRARTVACVASQQDHTSVFIWEYYTQRGTSFKVDHGPGSLFSISDPEWRSTHVLAPLLQPESKTIVLFANALKSKIQPHHRRHFAFSRFTYNGECIGSFQSSLSGLGNILSWDSVNAFAPIDDKGLFALYMRHWTSTHKNASNTLQFDERLNRLSFLDEGMRDIAATGDRRAWWKDTCYGFLSSKQDSARHTLANLGTSDTASYKPVVVEPNQIRTVFDIENINTPVVLNERFVVRNMANVFYLLCFEDSDKRPEKSESFFDLGTIQPLPRAR